MFIFDELLIDELALLQFHYLFFLSYSRIITFSFLFCFTHSFLCWMTHIFLLKFVILILWGHSQFFLLNKNFLKSFFLSLNLAYTLQEFLFDFNFCFSFWESIFLYECWVISLRQVRSIGERCLFWLVKFVYLFVAANLLIKLPMKICGQPVVKR